MSYLCTRKTTLLFNYKVNSHHPIVKCGNIYTYIMKHNVVYNVAVSGITATAQGSFNTTDEVLSFLKGLLDYFEGSKLTIMKNKATIIDDVLDGWLLSEFASKEEQHNNGGSDHQTLRPFKNAKEFLEAQSIHGLYVCFPLDKTLLEEEFREYLMPCDVNDHSVTVYDDAGDERVKTYQDLFDDKWRWQDGTPCCVINNI